MVLLTDEKFDDASRPPVCFKPPAARAQCCERCRRPLLPREDRYCRPCEATVVRRARAAAFGLSPLSLRKALGIGAAVGLVIIWAALHLSK